MAAVPIIGCGGRLVEARVYSVVQEGGNVGGKTGTAEKMINGRYSKTRLLTDFMAVLPADKPRFLLLIMLDEPQPIAETHGFATSGWNAAPVTAKVIERIAPLLGIEPRYDLPPVEKLCAN